MISSVKDNMPKPPFVLNVEKTLTVRTTKYVMMMENVNVEMNSMRKEKSVHQKIKKEFLLSVELITLISVKNSNHAMKITNVSVIALNVLNTLSVRRMEKMISIH